MNDDTATALAGAPDARSAARTRRTTPATAATAPAVACFGPGPRRGLVSYVVPHATVS